MGLIALIVVIVAIVAVLGNVGYLALLNSAAGKRGASGASVSQYVRSRWPVAGVTAAGAALALLLSGGEGFADVLAVVLGAGSAAVAGKSLSTTMERYRSNS
ncbi:hypothetical protein UO65_2396 [Actinokineospora spheciospongiae]|uniref:Uncharacterized protein n=1 Tax=Actinokineospora spheciospongiae TaxID=909613 RepID=W7J070_9PSEU|nr:hypothetical protein [Actinokineospora spheciospongiae]EWC62276.1 hypothetical protein UO65_2396 [Actinokineospora spheciospongiae]